MPGPMRFSFVPRDLKTIGESLDARYILIDAAADFARRKLRRGSGT
jgi:hypothetical protein